MATKPVTNKKTSKIVVEAATAATTRAPRVTTVRHSKTVPEKTAPAPAENSSERISYEFVAKLAYGYWEARGYQGGNAAEDWFRAEAECRQPSR